MSEHTLDVVDQMGIGVQGLYAVLPTPMYDDLKKRWEAVKQHYEKMIMVSEMIGNDKVNAQQFEIDRLTAFNYGYSETKQDELYKENQELKSIIKQWGESLPHQNSEQNDERSVASKAQ